MKPALRHLHRDRAEKVALAEIDAAVTQDRIGCGHMKKEIRQHKMVEVVGALHVAFVGRAERKRDVVISGAYGRGSVASGHWRP